MTPELAQERPQAEQQAVALPGKNLGKTYLRSRKQACSKCAQPRDRNGRYCKFCKREASRREREANPVTALQRAHYNARFACQQALLNCQPPPYDLKRCEAKNANRTPCIRIAMYISPLGRKPLCGTHRSFLDKHFIKEGKPHRCEMLPAPVAIRYTSKISTSTPGI